MDVAAKGVGDHLIAVAPPNGTRLERSRSRDMFISPARCINGTDKLPGVPVKPNVRLLRRPWLHAIAFAVWRIAPRIGCPVVSRLKQAETAPLLDLPSLR